MSANDIFWSIFAIAFALWIFRNGFLLVVQLLRDAYEVLTGKRRWDDD